MDYNYPGGEYDRADAEKYNQDKRRFRLAMWVVLALVTLLVLFFSMLITTHQADAATQPYPVNVVDLQFDNTACLLGATATVMNYSYPTQPAMYHTSSDDLAVIYRLKYGTSDWNRDGNTSHQAQELVRLFGFVPTYGHIPNAQTLRNMIAQQHYSIIFRDGTPQHAIVAVQYRPDTDEIIIADPIFGALTAVKADDLYNSLEPEKWFMYIK